MMTVVLRRMCALLALFTGPLLATPAHAETFDKGSLIIPMDTTYQDEGMLKAYGLLYALLLADVPVYWVIKAKKKAGDADFYASGKDFATSMAVKGHGYRGGPFVIKTIDAPKASPVIIAWLKNNKTTVHVAGASFLGRTGRLLNAAPTIAVIADKNEDIAFKYLNAAGITDSAGKAWAKGGVDVLSISGIAGPSTTKHNDGALFRSSGQPAYCQVMTMHWGVKEVVDEVVAEYREFLGFPTHMMAECQAVNAIENNKHGRFLTPNGFLIDNNLKEDGPFTFLNQDTPFVQMDGTFKLVGGSERAYSLPKGDKFHDRNVVMIKDASSAAGIRSVWMTGYRDGKCAIPDDDVGVPTCKAGVGKISYLGGHKYDVKLPISKNPKTQGTRLFLNSLFEAGCATAEGQPNVHLSLTGPTWTITGEAEYTLSSQNAGPGSALDLTLTYQLPSGASFVSATGGGAHAAGAVTWKVGDLGPKKSGQVTFKVKFASHGVYESSVVGQFKVGLSTKGASSNKIKTYYQTTPPPDGGAASGDGTSTSGGGHGDDDDGCSCSAGRGGPGALLFLLLAIACLRLRQRHMSV